MGLLNLRLVHPTTLTAPLENNLIAAEVRPSNFALLLYKPVNAQEYRNLA